MNLGPWKWYLICLILGVTFGTSLETLAFPHKKSSSCTDTYTLQKGDTFAKIAREQKKALHAKGPVFGPQSLVAKISALNKKQFQNPNLIQEGITIQLPSEGSCPSGKPIKLAQNTHTPAASHSRASRRIRRELSSAEPPLTVPVTVPPAQDPPLKDPEEEEEEVEDELPVVKLTPKIEKEKLKPVPALVVDETPAPKNSKFILGGAALAAGGSSTLPSGFVDLSLSMGRGVYLLASAEGFNATYSDSNGVTPTFTMLQNQYKAEFQFSLTRSFWMGLGYRYFSFGYAMPANTVAASHDAVVSAGLHLDIFENAEWNTTVDARMAVGCTSSAGGIFNRFPQFSGVGFKSIFHLPLGRTFFYGPYVFFDTTTIDLTQTAGTTGTAAFSYMGMGGGFHLGARF